MVYLGSSLMCRRKRLGGWPTCTGNPNSQARSSQAEKEMLSGVSIKRQKFPPPPRAL